MPTPASRRRRRWHCQTKLAHHELAGTQKPRLERGSLFQYRVISVSRYFSIALFQYRVVSVSRCFSIAACYFMPGDEAASIAQVDIKVAP